MFAVKTLLSTGLVALVGLGALGVRTAAAHDADGCYTPGYAPSYAPAYQPAYQPSYQPTYIPAPQPVYCPPPAYYCPPVRVYRPYERDWHRRYEHRPRIDVDFRWGRW